MLYSSLYIYPLERLKLLKACLTVAVLLSVSAGAIGQSAALSGGAKIDQLTARAQQGFVQDQIQLAKAFQWGRGVASNPVEAAHWFLRAADQGNPMAQVEIAYRYLSGAGVTVDERQAFQWFQRAAAEDYAPAQAALAYLLLNGRGAQRDEQEALRWLSRAAQQGFAPAQADLGFWYARGFVAPRDNHEALRWIKRAAQQHFSPAEFLLGTIYETGFASSRDPVEAGRWYRKAAEAGYAAAQANLGILYERGDGVSKDLPEAARWYKLAAEQGDSSGCANLARVYANGIGVATDYKLAYFWTIAAQYRESAMANPLPQSFVQELHHRIPENLQQCSGIASLCPIHKYFLKITLFPFREKYSGFIQIFIEYEHDMHDYQLSCLVASSPLVDWRMNDFTCSPNLVVPGCRSFSCSFSPARAVRRGAPVGESRDGCRYRQSQLECSHQHNHCGDASLFRAQSHSRK